MSNTPVVYEDESHGLGYAQPYPGSALPEFLPISASSNALGSSLVAFTGQGRVCGITVSSTLGAGQFVQVFDASSLPADGAVPILSVDIGATTARGIAFDPYGRWFTQGCIVCNSTTQGTKTLGAANCLFDVQYVPQVI